MGIGEGDEDAVGVELGTGLAAFVGDRDELQAAVVTRTAMETKERGTRRIVPSVYIVDPRLSNGITHPESLVPEVSLRDGERVRRTGLHLR
jgi:hypothetical protein